MVRLVDELHFTKSDQMGSFFSKKESDCILYSEEGVNFNVHKEILFQTDFLRNILSSKKAECCSVMEIFCPCSENDLKYMVEFLYLGKISCKTRDDLFRILDELNEVFGFPKEKLDQNNDIGKEREVCIIRSYEITLQKETEMEINNNNVKESSENQRFDLLTESDNESQDKQMEITEVINTQFETDDDAQGVKIKLK